MKALPVKPIAACVTVCGANGACAKGPFNKTRIAAWNAVTSLEGALFGYFTTPITGLLCALLLALFSVSTAIFTDPPNVEPAPQTIMLVNTLAKTAPDTELMDRETTPRSAGETWNYVDGMRMALRAHIPMIQFTMRDEWEPADRPIKVDTPYFGERKLVIEANDWAAFMTLVHWILLSIIVAVTAAVAIERRS
jgi:hypothetical protein